jgi:sugar lactone lactonase YvrE
MLSTVTTIQGLSGGLAIDPSGNLYVAATGNRIQKISNTGIIAVFAGSGVAGNQGDGRAATAAQLNTPSGVAVDGTGNVYIADTRNHRIRVIASDGTIALAAGNGSEGFSGDGSPAVLAQLRNPTAVAADAAGNVYIADSGNFRVRKVDPDGRITTIAGSGTAGFSGDGGAAQNAQFGAITSLAVDKGGNLYVADSGNRRIRKVAADGIVTTVLGTELEK